MTGISRRQFLRGALGAGVLAEVGGPGALLSAAGEPRADTSGRKLIIVLFGGGTRSSESMDDPKHQFIPKLWKEMVPRGTLFTNMRVEGKVVHPNSAGSIVTGHWEYEDVDWSRPVKHPSVFEIVRKERGLTDTAAWLFAYASILAQVGASSDKGYGTKYGANVVVPPTIKRAAAEEMERLMHAARVKSGEEELKAVAECAKLARSASSISLDGLKSEGARNWVQGKYGAWKSADCSTSHDLFLTDLAVDCMKTYSPDVMAVMYGEIDCAHYGSWSRYTEAIQRTDELTWRLWRAAEETEGYKGQTLMLILPDHGRELESSSGTGFIHHSDFYTDRGADEGCRRVWMLALGPGVAAGKKVDKPHPITCVAATGLEWMGLKASKGAAGGL